MKRITLFIILILVMLSSVPIVFADEPSGIINIKTQNTPILNLFLDFFINIILTVIIWRVIMTIIKFFVQKKA